MLLHINHFRKGRASVASDVVSTFLSLFDDEEIDPAVLPHLNVHLDWVQYKANFRETVMVRKAVRDGELLPLVEVVVDERQVCKDTLREDLSTALNATSSDPIEDGRSIALESFEAGRSSIIWNFNKLYWHRLADWERFSGKQYENALPSGASDGHNPDAIKDSVVEFWDLLKDMESKGQLPDEFFVIEIGVGTAERAHRWLDMFKELDSESGTGFYPKIRFLLADYAMATLDRARERLRDHGDVTSFIVVDAVDPFKSLSFLRYKVLYIHLTNVYDNLPTDEMVLRDGRYFFVEVRAYVKADDAEKLSDKYGVSPDTLVKTVSRLLDVGLDYFPDADEGVGFWQDVWAVVNLEERLVALDSLSEAELPAGVRASHIEELVGDTSADIRFHLSSGAVESFTNTIPLLHPRGYLQVQDIFVTDIASYLQGFRGPGKMDGSIVNWVNGALLAEVGEQAGYDVHFTPFSYREGSRTSILHTTQRE